MYRFLAAFVLAALLPRPALPQTSEQTELILKRLDQLEKQNAELLREVKALRAALPAPDPSPPPEVAPAVADLSDRQEVSEHRIEELAQTKVEASQRYPVQLTGTALFNAFLNGANNGGNQNPTVASLTSGTRTGGATLRQTVVGLKFTGPQTFLGGTVSGSLYMDFFAGSAASLNHLVRLRVATVQLDWANTTLSVGQDKPIVSRREPNSFAQVGVSPLTGAGNPWLWQPQARLEQHFQLSPNTRVTAEAGIFQTAEGTNSPRPAFQTRVALRKQYSNDRFIEFAPVFHTSTSHVAGTSVPSRLYGIDWLLKPSSRFEISGLVFRGRNFANLGALGGSTLTPSGAIIPVRGAGGWLQVRYQATRNLSFTTYGGQQDDHNRDLLSGSIGKNQYYAGNVMYLLAPNVISAFEFGQNRTDYVGIGNRLNNHYDLALAYLF